MAVPQIEACWVRAIGLPLAIENKDFKAQIGNRERQIGGNRYTKALAESVHF
jgi:hypothetical protein